MANELVPGIFFKNLINECLESTKKEYEKKNIKDKENNLLVLESVFFLIEESVPIIEQNEDNNTYYIYFINMLPFLDVIKTDITKHNTMLNSFLNKLFACPITEGFNYFDIIIITLLNGKKYIVDSNNKEIINHLKRKVLDYNKNNKKNEPFSKFYYNLLIHRIQECFTFQKEDNPNVFGIGTK